MDKSMGWKVGLIVIVIAFSVAMFYPPGEKIVLGLDLKGGMHLVFQVQTEKAIQKHVDNNVHRLRTLLKESSITFTDVARRGADKIEASGVLFEDNRTLKDIFDDDFMEWDYRFSGDKAILTIKELVKRQLKDKSALSLTPTNRSLLSLNYSKILWWRRYFIANIHENLRRFRVHYMTDRS